MRSRHTTQGGNKDFKELTLATERKFKSKPRVYNDFNFAGMNIKKNGNSFIMQKTDYVDKLSATKFRSPCTISEFRSLRGQLNLINHTRSEISFSVAYLSQVTEESLCKDDVKLANKVVKHLTETRNVTLRFVPLDLRTMHIFVYTDGSFANNKDCSSQIGFIVFLNDDKNNANLIHISLPKAQRVTRSIFGGEIYAFADGFDYEFILQHDLRNMLKKNLPLRMFTDSKSTFDIVTKMSYTEEKRLMIDVSAIREAYDPAEIDKNAWIRSFYNPQMP